MDIRFTKLGMREVVNDYKHFRPVFFSGSSMDCTSR